MDTKKLQQLAEEVVTDARAYNRKSSALDKYLHLDLLNRKSLPALRKFLSEVPAGAESEAPHKEEKICRNCRHFRKSDAPATKHRCVARPPAVLPSVYSEFHNGNLGAPEVKTRPLTVWPEVWFNDWCSEFAPPEADLRMPAKFEVKKDLWDKWNRPEGAVPMVDFLQQGLERDLISASGKDREEDLTDREACAIRLFAGVPFKIRGDYSGLDFEPCGVLRVDGKWNVMIPPQSQQ